MHSADISYLNAFADDVNMSARMYEEIFRDFTDQRTGMKYKPDRCGIFPCHVNLKEYSQNLNTGCSAAVMTCSLRKILSGFETLRRNGLQIQVKRVITTRHESGQTNAGKYMPPISMIKFEIAIRK